MIDEERAAQRAARRRARVTVAAIALGATWSVTLLVGAVVVWGWLPTLVTVYASSILGLIGVLWHDGLAARRAGEPAPAATANTADVCEEPDGAAGLEPDRPI